MKPTDNKETFQEAWASLRQPGSQWVTALLSHTLHPGQTKPSQGQPPVKRVDT